MSDPKREPRDLAAGDIDKVVALHKDCFKEFFLTALGDRAIRCFYEAALADDGSVAVVLEETDPGAIVGVAVGTLNPAFHTNLFRRDWSVYVLGLLGGLVRSDIVRGGILERAPLMRRILEVNADDSLARAGVPEPEFGPEARFLDVAVHPDVRGGRNAERLVEYFTERVFAKGAGRIGGSVKPNNLGSLILYKRLGWNVKKTSPQRFDVWFDRSA